MSLSTLFKTTEELTNINLHFLAVFTAPTKNNCSHFILFKTVTLTWIQVTDTLHCFIPYTLFCWNWNRLWRIKKRAVVIIVVVLSIRIDKPHTKVFAVLVFTVKTNHTVLKNYNPCLIYSYNIVFKLQYDSTMEHTE